MTDIQRVADIYGLTVDRVEAVIQRVRRIQDVCLPAALENPFVQRFINEGSDHLRTFDTPAKRLAKVQKEVPLRLMFEHGHCFTEAPHPLFLPGSWAGGKSGWGKFLQIDPLKPTDMYSPVRPGWVWTSGNEAFNRRMALKDMLGKGARKMVEDARRETLRNFLAYRMTDEKAAVLQLRTGLTPHEFWKAVKGHPKKEPVPQQAVLF